MSQTQQPEIVLAGPHGEALVRKTPGVCGGDACVRDTRIMVWLLVTFRQGGMSDAEILANYPTLTSQDLAAAWQYHHLRPNEIAEAIRTHEQNDA